MTGLYSYSYLIFQVYIFKSLSFSNHNELLSRFGRDLVSCLDAIRILKSLPEPVHCYFEKENIHTADPESELLISVHASISQEESVNLSASIAWGFRSLAQQGIVLSRTQFRSENSEQFIR